MRAAILLIAYGAGNPASRAGLAAFESRCRERFAGLPIRWAYTSDLLRTRLARQKQKSDSVFKALMRLNFEKYGRIAIQPLLVIPGREYEEVKEAAENVGAQCGLSCSLGLPLLSAEPGKVCSALIACAAAPLGAAEDVIFMAHGARHPAGRMYKEIAHKLENLDSHIHIGTMSGEPSLHSILPSLKSRRIWLQPFFANAGLHAMRDMAGDSPQSWRTQLEAAGHECEITLSGLVEREEMADIWLDHLGEAIARLEQGVN